ncbi:MAG: helix-turn-helix transcriptional regulator [bacterium]
MDEQLGHAVRRARKKHGLSQQDLEDRTGIARETISRIENARQGVGLNTALDLLGALDYELVARPKDQQDLRYLKNEPQEK